MPLIRAMRAWFGRRLHDVSIYGSPADGGMSQGSIASFWFFVFIVALPVTAFLGLIGLLYELIIRIDGRRVRKAAEWTMASALAFALLVGAYWVYIRR